MNIEPGKDIATAILAIDSDAEFVVKNEDLDNIEWTSTPIDKATIQAKMTELSTAYNNLDYARKRVAEYQSVQD